MKIYQRVLSALIIIVTIVAGMGCGQRRELSDKELAQVFHDAFLTNAYTTGRSLRLDSLRLYEPIFNHYGYTTEDVQYTIGSFSRRKSARLSDVVEEAIRMLEREGEKLDYEVAILDTVNQIAYRRTIKTIYQDSLIEMRDFRDTTKMLITIENPKAGEYTINFDYLIDKLDTTPNGYLAITWMERDRSDEEMEQLKKKMAKSEEKEGEKKEKKEEPQEISRLLEYQKNNRNMVRKVVSKYSNKINITELCERLKVQIAMPVKVEGEPIVTVKNLSIKYLPTLIEARDSLFEQLLQVRILDDKLLFPPSDESMDSL